jgi:hypothetical protein
VSATYVLAVPRRVRHYLGLARSVVYGANVLLSGRDTPNVTKVSHDPLSHALVRT